MIHAIDSQQIQRFSPDLQAYSEVAPSRVTIREKVGADMMQNPSDPETPRDVYKGPEYQVQAGKTRAEENCGGDGWCGETPAKSSGLFLVYIVS